ncbi:MAG: hypothetical protein NVS9B4_17000 [Candidatus Acidiferrum sp.]
MAASVMLSRWEALAQTEIPNGLLRAIRFGYVFNRTLSRLESPEIRKDDGDSVDRYGWVVPW